MFCVSSGHSYLIQLPPEGNLHSVIKQSVAMDQTEENGFLNFCSICPSSYLKETAYIPILSTMLCGALHSD